MNLAVFAKVGAVVVEHCRSVVVDTGNRPFVDGDDHGHAVLFGDGREPFDGGARDGLGGIVPATVLRRAEVRTVEYLLQTENLDATLPGLFDERQVFLEHRLLDFGDGTGFVIQRV